MPAVEHQVTLPDRYRVTRRIASGGMATVYACEDQVLGRLVAVKVLAAHFSADTSAAERFQREARAAARVSDHPHVVTIYDIGEHEGTAFIVMEYFPGGTVADRQRADDPIPHPTALRWIDETAAALDHAHGAGIVHRDVKPANLLLDANGRVAVADFGIARMASEAGVTSTGVVLGTAAYLSPEQALGQPASAASDRYALAVVAYELLTGGKLFPAEHPAAQARAHVETPPPRPSELAPDLAPAVDRVLWRGLEKDPDDRWPTASAMVEALEDSLGDQAEPATVPTAPVAPRPARPARPPSRPSRPVAATMGSAAPTPRRRRNWAPVLVAAAIVGLLAGAAIAGIIGGGSESPSTQAKRTTPTSRPARSTPQPAQTQTQAAPAQSTAAPAASATKSPSQLMSEGHTQLTQGNYDTAIDTLRQATKDCPVSRTNPCAYALYDLGVALTQAGRPQEAIPVLQQRLQNPDQHGQVQKALNDAQKAAGGKPGKGPKKPKKGD